MQLTKKTYYVVHLLIKETTNQKSEASKNTKKERKNEMMRVIINDIVAFMTIASFFWLMAIVCYIRVISTSAGSPMNINQSNI